MRAVSVGSGVVGCGTNGKREPVCGGSKICELHRATLSVSRTTLTLDVEHPEANMSAGAGSSSSADVGYRFVTET